jgi:allantoinase
VSEDRPYFVLRSTRVVTPKGVHAAAAVIESGRIAAILPHDAELETDCVVSDFRPA